MDEGRTARRKRVGLLMLTARLERAVLLGRRDMDDDCAAGWKEAGLLGERELDF